MCWFEGKSLPYQASREENRLSCARAKSGNFVDPIVFVLILAFHCYCALPLIVRQGDDSRGRTGKGYGCCQMDASERLLRSSSQASQWNNSCEEPVTPA